MSSVSRHSGDNYGGVIKASYSILQDVKDQIDWLADPLTISQDTLDNYFHTLRFEPKTAKYRRRRRNTNQGPVYNVDLTMDFHKDRDDIIAEIENVSDRRLLIYIETTNGDRYLLGFENEGLMQTEDLDTGTMPSDLNHVGAAFSGSLTKKPAKITVTN